MIFSSISRSSIIITLTGSPGLEIHQPSYNITLTFITIFLNTVTRTVSDHRLKINAETPSAFINLWQEIREVVWKRHQWETANSEATTCFKLNFSHIRWGWLFLNQWFGLHLRWLFSNYVSTCIQHAVQEPGSWKVRRLLLLLHGKLKEATNRLEWRVTNHCKLF